MFREKIQKKIKPQKPSQSDFPVISSELKKKIFTITILLLLISGPFAIPAFVKTVHADEASDAIASLQQQQKNLTRDWIVENQKQAALRTAFQQNWTRLDLTPFGISTLTDRTQIGLALQTSQANLNNITKQLNDIDAAIARINSNPSPENTAKVLADTKKQLSNDGKSFVDKKTTILENAKTAGENDCVFNNPVFGTFSACLNQAALYIGNLILSLAALFLYLVSMLFDWFIKSTVSGMGEIIGGIGSLRTAWTVARDIANAFFIFILLYLSIATILDLGVETKRQVIRVILMALLINFSLFFTNIMIDASNILATAFYNATITSAQSSRPSTADLALGTNTGSISSVFLNAMAIQKIYNPGDAQSGNQSKNKNTKAFMDSNNISFGRIIATTVFGTLLMFTTALVLLASLTLFGTRLGTLLVCMVFSPIAFALMAVPDDHYAKKIYWDQLIPQLLFAPVYMLFLFLTVTIVAKLPPGAFQGTNTAAGAGFTGALADIANIFYNYLIINTLLMTTLVSARELGVAGAESAISWVEKGKGALQSVVGRNTIGRAARNLDERWANTNAPRGFNWLVGGQGVLGSKLRGVSTGFLKDAKFGGEKSGQDVYDEGHKLESATATNAKKKAVLDAINATNYGPGEDGKRKKQAAIQTAMLKLGAKEAAELAEADRSLLHNDDFLGNLSDSQYEAIRKSEHLTEAEKEEAGRGRFKDVIEAAQKYTKKVDNHQIAFRDRANATYTDVDGQVVKNDFHGLTEEAAKDKFLNQAPDISKDSTAAYRKMRSFTGKKMDALNQVAPEVLNDTRIMSIFKQGMVDYAKTSESFSQLQQEQLRHNKDINLIEGRAMAYGVDFLSPEYAALGGDEGSDFRKLMGGLGRVYDEIDYTTNPTGDMSMAIQNSINSRTAQITSTADPVKKATLQKEKESYESLQKMYAKVAIRDANERKTWAEVGRNRLAKGIEKDKTAEEVSKSKSSQRFAQANLDFYNGAIGQQFRRQDNGDQQKIWNHLAIHFKNGTLTPQNAELLEKMATNKEMKDFFRVYTPEERADPNSAANFFERIKGANIAGPQMTDKELETYIHTRIGRDELGTKI
ncbi:MAG: hypothetical protein PHV93_02440 [Candidatus Pacebacteria bacterium]|nr:hypothetical protein [Candidatus Paceibacterota bacterium]